MIKVAICVPFHPSAPVAPAFMTQFLNTLQELGKYDIRLLFKMEYPVDQSRNELTKEALNIPLQWGADYLWWIDSDSILQTGTFEKLISADVDIISGLYLDKSRRLPVARYWNEKTDSPVWIPKVPRNSILEVGAVGLGCCLVKRKVFEGIDKPYFKYGEEHLSEDIYFCRKAAKAGYKIFLHTGALVGHYGSMILPDDTTFL